MKFSRQCASHTAILNGSGIKRNKTTWNCSSVYKNVYSQRFNYSFSRSLEPMLHPTTGYHPSMYRQTQLNLSGKCDSRPFGFLHDYDSRFILWLWSQPISKENNTHKHTYARKIRITFIRHSRCWAIRVFKRTPYNHNKRNYFFVKYWPASVGGSVHEFRRRNRIFKNQNLSSPV